MKSAFNIFITCFIFIKNDVFSQDLVGKNCYLNGTVTVCKNILDCPSQIEEIYNNKIPQKCGFEEDQLIVCCKNYTVGDFKVNDMENMKQYTDLKNAPINILKCLEYVKQTIDLPILPIDSTAIIGGSAAGLSDIPHMAALGFGKINDIKWQCGGTLISEKFILTAAHCLKHRDYGNITFVRLGDIFLSGSSYSKQDFKVIRRIPHPEYKPPLIYNDIALLELNESVVFKTEIKPACLNSENDLKSVFYNYGPEVSGWGIIEYGGSISEYLQRVYLDIFTFEECNKTYRYNKRKFSNGIQSDKQICAGGRGSERDTCQGDSGGPLQNWNYDTRLYNVVGITSFGLSCGIKDIPAIYTKVSYFIPWISSIVWP